MSNLGKIVFVKITADQAEMINRRREDYNKTEVPAWPLGAQAHVGNATKEGDEYPMIVTREWSEGYFNGQLMLDGNDTLWMTSVLQGSELGQWHESPSV